MGYLFAFLVLIGFSGQTLAHDWYSELSRPGVGSCCGGDDCAPYPHRTTPGETGYELFIRGQWWPVPASVVIGMFSPDGQAHACCYYYGAKGGCDSRDPVVFRCVVLPGQGV
jgi:hypothetical protein